MERGRRADIGIGIPVYHIRVRAALVGHVRATYDEALPGGRHRGHSSSHHHRGTLRSTMRPAAFMHHYAWYLQAGHVLNASWGYGAGLCNWWVQTGATGLVRESFGWRAARGADTRSQTTARPPSNIVHSPQASLHDKQLTSSGKHRGKVAREQPRLPLRHPRHPASHKILSIHPYSGILCTRTSVNLLQRTSGSSIIVVTEEPALFTCLRMPSRSLSPLESAGFLATETWTSSLLNRATKVGQSWRLRGARCRGPLAASGTANKVLRCTGGILTSWSEVNAG